MSPARLGLWLAGLTLACLGLAVWALGVGSLRLPPARLWAALTAESPGREALIVTAVRAPRVLAALAVGAALACAGAILQRILRNPLAEPGLLGINAGAAFAMVLAAVLAGTAPRATLIPAAMAGAALASGLVWALGSAGRGGATPLRLVLAGVIVASFLASLTQALLIYDAAALDSTRLWTAGSLAGIQPQELAGVLPWIGAGLLAALAALPGLEILGLEDDAARGLGVDPVRWRLIAAVIVVLLSGGAVALAGPVAFLGLIVPHALRLASGAGFRALLPLCALGGAALTLTADTLPRALAGVDVPVGITLALIGGPVFLALARRQRQGARG